MRDMLFDLVEFSGDVDGDESVFDNFLEVEETNGMTVMTAQRATDEIKEIHKSLKEGFAFKNSPILGDLSRLEAIPQGKVLSSGELIVTEYNFSFIEKAFSGGKFLAKLKESDLDTGKILDNEALKKR